jgi:hypothetical protein
VRVQVKRILASGMAFALCVTAVGVRAEEEDPAAGTLLRLFSDSDKVAVRSMMGDYALSLPRDLSMKIQWNHERVMIPGVDATAGSAEAVDAITTASRPISGDAFQDFVKVRNEFDGSLTRGPATFEFYHSAESDYTGRQLGARYEKELMGEQLNLSVGTSYAWDAIAPLADDDTQTPGDSKRTLHGNVVATRILTPTSVVRLGVEINRVEGLQHNPYRNVYAGGTVVPERHPRERMRSDAFLRWNQYFTNRSSLRLSYRFYADDWGIDSHEADTKFSQYVTRGIFTQYEYRYYTQTAATFYRDEYESVDGIDGYRSGDYRMSALSSHLFGSSLHLDLGTVAESVPVLRNMGVRMSYERYFNSNNYSANILETGLDYRF